MNRLSIDIRVGLLLAIGLTLVFYWNFWTLVSTPMSGPLQDPAVSHWTFVPGLKTLQYELFNHFNILWSNLRGLGMPTLANDVQTAPLYPLTILLVWVPGEYFWNVFVLARWIIFATGAYVLASRCFRFNVVGSSIFVLTFVFALYHARWINHPFLNGLAAGVWYLYFTLVVLNSGQYQNYYRNHIGSLWGLVISTYSVITCGFPEASVTIALATSLIVPFAFFRSVTTSHRLATKALTLIFLANILGFAIASPQILALTEMIELATSEFRPSHALNQYNVGVVDFLLGKVTLLGRRPPDPNIHVFGLIPVFLFLYGLLFALVSRPKKTWGHTALLACGLFFLFKNFPVFGEYFAPIHTLHREISSIPVVAQTWLTSYSFPLLLLFFAFFAGHGAHALAAPTPHRTGPSMLKAGICIIALMLIVLAATNLASKNLNDTNYVDILMDHTKVRWIGLVYSIFCLALVSVCFRAKRAVTVKYWIVIVGLATLEYAIILPGEFLDRKDYWRQHDRSDIATIIDRITNDVGINKHNVRFADYGTNHFGFLINNGYSTFRNGATAMYSSRQQAYRRSVLGADWDGYFPLLQVPNYDGWVRSSTGLFLSSESLPELLSKKTLSTENNTGQTTLALNPYDAKNVDRVGCGVSATQPDGMPDNVFVLDFDLTSHANTYDTVVHIDLVRRNPSGVNRTSNLDYVLGVSLDRDSPLLNDEEGGITIPLNEQLDRLWLFACVDSVDRSTSKYLVEVTLYRDPEIRQLSKSSIRKYEIPSHLLTGGKTEDYIKAVLHLAYASGGTPEIITRHAFDLETAIKTSSSPNLAIAHTLHFLKGVGAQDFFDAQATSNILLFSNPTALSRAYIPSDCLSSGDETDSLRKIIDKGFKIGQAVVELPPGKSIEVCEEHQSVIKSVDIISDRGRYIKLEPILGPTVLVLNDNYYPGWKAVDTHSEQNIAIYPANLTFRAMVLSEAREYQLELRYWPPWLTAALIISLMGVTILIVLTVLGRRRL